MLTPNPSQRIVFWAAGLATAAVLSSIAGCGKPPTEDELSAVEGMVIYEPWDDFEDRTQGERYDALPENRFVSVRANPLSTFSVDVDTASYANVRRFLEEDSLPPPEAVRVEEMINYFDYAYPAPDSLDPPFAIHVEIASCPWQPEHHLAKIGIQGYEVPQEQRPQCNLVFLVDVSGSMDQPDKLPLLQSGLRTLLEILAPDDTVAIVTYAGSAGIALAPTSCREKQTIDTAIQRLRAGGSTAGAAGIETAYRLAQDGFRSDQVNRVILCTDGDFNVGITDRDELVRLIETKAQSGVFLSVFGFGTGNYNDAMLEKLADHGNGNYGYIDSHREADKVFRREALGSLLTIAKDVKLQIDFNPRHVEAYRLVGYENRRLADRDFDDDSKDAGEIGSGHTVTALYELIPPGGDIPHSPAERSKYQDARSSQSEAAMSDEWFSLRIRYKRPDGDTSEKLEFPVTSEFVAPPSNEFKFAAGVALFGQLLRGGSFTGKGDYEMAEALAEAGKGEDPSGDRAEMLALVRRARSIAGSSR